MTYMTDIETKPPRLQRKLLQFITIKMMATSAFILICCLHILMI